jgi:formiminotetrahydrofolate cyclodeaminase
MVEAIDVGKKRKEFLDPLPGQAIKQHQKLQKVLQEAKSKKQLGNLYEHIVDVINHIVKCCPD